MVFINGVKYACATCIKGHRSTACHHSDRPLLPIKRKGRPITQCAHCRELRKTQKVHVKCTCNERKKEGVMLLPAQGVTTSHELSNGSVESRFKIEGQNFIDLNQQHNYGDKHSVEALLNPCQCTTGAKCICCRPVEQDSNGLSSIPNFPYTNSVHYDQFDRMYAASATTMTTAGPSGTNVNSSRMPILPMSTTLTSPTSTIPPLPGELLGQFAMSVPLSAPPFASPRPPIQPPVFKHNKPLDNNSQSTLSWNGGYVSDDESSLPSMPRSSESGTYSERESRGHRRIASYPSILYLPKPEAPRPIEPQNYTPYHEDEKSTRNERAVFRDQLSHNTSGDIMNMVYRSFQSCPSVMPDGSCCGNTNRNPNIAVSVCRCGTGCKCQGCDTHTRRANGDGGYEVPSTYLDSQSMSSTGGCCSSTPSTIAQPQHTVILDEDENENEDRVKDLCEEYLLK